MEPAQSVVAFLVRFPVAPSGVPRWALCRIGGTPMHAFPEGLGMADIIERALFILTRQIGDTAS